MARAVILRVGQSEFLAETDDSVGLPANLDLGTDSAIPGVPKGLQPVAKVGSLAADFDDVNRLIVSCCNQLFDAIAKIPEPEKVSVEFGIKLAGESGLPMVVKATGEANFKVSVEWARPGKKSS
jgi:hypothetical protein